MLRLVDPDLQYRLQTIERTIDLHIWQLAVQDLATNRADRVLQQKLESLQSQRQVLLTELHTLQVTAPFAGTVVDLAEDLTPGEWVAKEMPLLTLIDASHSLVTGYVAETELHLIAAGAAGTFYPEDPDSPLQSGRLLRMDQTTTQATHRK